MRGYDAIPSWYFISFDIPRRVNMVRVHQRVLLYMIFALFVTFGLKPAAHAQAQTNYDSLDTFFSFRTKDLRIIYYSKEPDYLIKYVSRCFQNSWDYHRRFWNYTPSEEVTMLLHDMNDYGTGGTSSIPWNYLNIGIEPYDYVYETSPTNERMNWVMMHELTHMVDLDKAAASDRLYRSIFFGKVVPSSENPISMFYSYLASPRYYSPRWYHEGLAVFMETWMSGGIGRTLGGYDEMTFRTMVCDSAYFYDFVGLESEGKTIDFQVGVNSYLYGTRFVSYLAVNHGVDKLLRWVNRSEDADRSYASQFEKVYGASLDEEWTRWIDFEHSWQKENLDSIRKYTLTPQRPVITAPLGSVSRTFYDSADAKFIVAVAYPGRIAHVATIDRFSGKMEKICEIPTLALYYVSSLAYDDSSGSLFYTTHNGSMWRELNIVNVKTGETRQLIKYSRVGDLAFDPVRKQLWGVRHHNGFSMLVRIPPPYTDMYPVFTLEYGYDIYDLDISPDGTMLSAGFMNISGDQRLIKMDIPQMLEGAFKMDTLWEFDKTAPLNFVFSRDGKYLYGASYSTGVSNIFRYEFATREMKAVSNCETGYFRPLPLPGDSLLVYRYSGKGFLPVIIPIRVTDSISAVKYLGEEVVERYPVVETWKIDPPSKVNIDTLITSKGVYNSLAELKLASLYPIVQGYKDVLSYGLTSNISDPLGLQTIQLTLGISPYRWLPKDERVHASVVWRYWQWKASASYNNTDFYDLFGPTKTSRKGYSLALLFSEYIINERPEIMEYTLSAAGYGGLERLPDFQNVSATYDKFFTFDGKLNYRYLLRSIGAVDVERGVRCDVQSQNMLVLSRWYPKVVANADFGIMLPIDHSSLWIRTSAGYSPRDRDDPFANFYFGGFGNNWLDYQESKRYRDYVSFPGVEIDEISGTEYGKVMLEMTMPPLRFKRLGIPDLYCMWGHMSLFSSSIITNFTDRESRTEYVNFGAQMDFRFVLFTSLDLTLSTGYAVAVEKSGHPSKEFMVSLKIL